jgi:hypothetical protein
VDECENKVVFFFDFNPYDLIVRKYLIIFYKTRKALYQSTTKKKLIPNLMSTCTEVKSIVREMLRHETMRTIAQIQSISVKEKRSFFSLLRRYSSKVNENWIFPLYGISVGELCVAQVLEDVQAPIEEQDQSHENISVRKKPRFM